MTILRLTSTALIVSKIGYRAGPMFALLNLQGIAPYQNAVLVDSSSRVLTLSENLRALLANGASADDGLVRLTASDCPSPSIPFLSLNMRPAASPR